MPVPKRKVSKSRRDKRFANKGIAAGQFSQCSNCQEPLAQHAACKSCGFYKGAKVLRTKTDRKLKRTEERKAKATKEKTSPAQEPQE